MDRDISEIFRRQDVDPNFESGMNAKVIDRPEQQTIILVNIANSNHTRPYSKVPAFRVLAFPRDMKHAEQIVDDKFDSLDERVYSSLVDHSFLICKDDTHQSDPMYGPEVCRRLLLANDIKARQREIDFRQRVKESVGEKAKLLETEIDESPFPELPPEAKRPPETQRSMKSLTNNSKSLSRDMESRGQNFFVFSVLPNDDEPSVTIYGCWDTEEEATQYVINGIGRRVNTVDLFVARMYEWIFPELASNTDIPETFRKDELNSIMSAPRAQQKKVDEYRENNPNRPKEGNVLASDALVTVDKQDPRIMERTNEKDAAKDAAQFVANVKNVGNDVVNKATNDERKE